MDSAPSTQQGLTATSELPAVSIIIPCRNESGSIHKCLDSILTNGYPLDRMEILVIDGMSDDGTRDILREYGDRSGIIRIVDNPQKVTPFAVNRGIQEAKNEVLMRLDAHTVCHRGYIQGCVEGLTRYGGDDTGGLLRIVPQKETPMGRAIARALSQPLGVGNLRYRFATDEKPQVVDTVAFFCCRRELFERIGTFNEKLTRIQDMEFKNRVSRLGCKVLLVPTAIADYHARSTLRSFWRHNWADGFWTVWSFADAQVMPVRTRHLVPMAFVGALIFTGLLASALQPLAWLFIAVVVSYVLLTGFVTAKIAAAEHDVRYLWLVPLVFATMHFGRGLGSLSGALRLLVKGKVTRAVGLIFGRLPA